jgi:hypothetical protein
MEPSERFAQHELTVLSVKNISVDNGNRPLIMKIVTIAA